MEITNELLHEKGFQSYFDDQEGWFEFEDLILFLDDPEKGTWVFEGETHELKTFEDIEKYYEQVKGKPFTPGKPIGEDMQWLFHSDFIGPEDARYKLKPSWLITR